MSHNPCITSPRYFHCQCHRCSAKPDFSRGFRCPRCYQGSVYPEQQPHAVRGSTSATGTDLKGYDACCEETLGVSACTACRQVPTTAWLKSAARVEEYIDDLIDWLEEHWDAAAAMVRRV